MCLYLDDIIILDKYLLMSYIKITVISLTSHNPEILLFIIILCKKI